MLGKPKQNCSRDRQETQQQELLLLYDKNKQGKCGFATDWGKSTVDTYNTELLNAFFTPAFNNKVSQAFTHTDRVQGEEKIPRVEKDWFHKTLLKS